jgi:UDP-glucuronate 4-epimerase
MDALVTGVAGFVGSHLAETLIKEGHRVLGIDCFTPYYEFSLKRANLAQLESRQELTLVEADLRTATLEPLLDGVDVVFHLAAQPGVRLSWSSGFTRYTEHNVIATQRLLEAAKGARLQRIVYASSSSVYGNAPAYPTTEDDLPRPHSPYGVTKLAAEHLCGLYAANYGIPTVALRYFTAYGPRQRPDMAFTRFIHAALNGRPLPVYGTGEQIRDFTFVGDVVDATITAATADVEPGSVFNIAGGSSVSVNEVLELLEELIECELDIERLPEQPGDMAVTGGSTERARELLGWKPQVDLPEGLAAQIAAQRASGRPRWLPR